MEVLFTGTVGFFDFPSLARVIGDNVFKKEVKDKIENYLKNDHATPHN
jgi:hypothetical protein